MPMRKTTASRIAHRHGMLRVLAFSLVLTFVCAGLRMRFARAEVIDNGIVVGRQMAELVNAAHGDVNQLSLNGQSVMVASQLTKDSPEAVLGRYEQLCREHAAHSFEEWRALLSSAEADSSDLAPSTDMPPTGILRGGTREEGTVMCFVRSAQSKPTLRESLDVFVQTGEMAALGQLRYAYAKRTPNGRTHVLAAWTSEKFNLKEMVPETGDAPGQDFEALARPAESRRIFSIRIVGAPYGVNVYESDVPPAVLGDAYDAALLREGWFAVNVDVDSKRATPSLAGATARVYEKDGVLMSVVSHLEKQKTITAFGIAGIPQRVEEQR
jgi:hypothetical protein